MRKNKVCDFTVAGSITHILCEPHVLQGIRRPHDCTGLPFIEGKKAAGQGGNSQRKAGSIGLRERDSNYVPMKGQYQEIEVSSEPVTKAQNKEWLHETLVADPEIKANLKVSCKGNILNPQHSNRSERSFHCRALQIQHNKQAC